MCKYNIFSSCPNFIQRGTLCMDGCISYVSIRTKFIVSIMYEHFMEMIKPFLGSRKAVEVDYEYLFRWSLQKLLYFFEYSFYSLNPDEIVVDMESVNEATRTTSTTKALRQIMRLTSKSNNFFGMFKFEIETEILTLVYHQLQNNRLFWGLSTWFRIPIVPKWFYLDLKRSLWWKMEPLHSMLSCGCLV